MLCGWGLAQWFGWCITLEALHPVVTLEVFNVASMTGMRAVRDSSVMLSSFINAVSSVVVVVVVVGGGGGGGDFFGGGGGSLAGDVVVVVVVIIVVVVVVGPLVGGCGGGGGGSSLVNVAVGGGDGSGSLVVVVFIGGDGDGGCGGSLITVVVAAFVIMTSCFLFLLYFDGFYSCVSILLL